MSQSDFVTRGQALVAAGQFQEAVKVCRLGLLGRPTTVEGRVVLGQALLALKRFDEVLAEMRVALELDHTSVSAQVLKGEALLRKGDGGAAVDVLARARAQAPNDPRIMQLLAEAERAAGRPAGSAGHPAVNFFAGNEVPTKHYPNHPASGFVNPGEEESGPSGSYTRPTSLSAPGAKKRSSERQAAQPEGTPSPDVLAIGDRSGTVEVDPDAEGVEVDEEELGDLASPPVSASRPAVIEPRGSVKQSRSYAAPGDHENDVAFAVAARRPRHRKEVSSVELIADDLEQLVVDDDDDDLYETKGRLKEPGPYSAVRNAVQVAPGPLADPGGSMRSMHASRPTAIGPAQPPLARVLASQPPVMQQVGPGIPPTPSPLPPPPHSASHHTVPGPHNMARPAPGPHGDGYTLSGPHGQGNAPLPRPFGNPGPIAAAMPTVAAPPSGVTWRAAGGAPPPAAPYAPTMALTPAPPAPMADPSLFGRDGTPPAWARQTVAVSPAPGRPAPIDEALAVLAAAPADVSGVASVVEPSGSGKSHKTGIRKSRSRLQIVVWIMIGTLVIGGGVFAGFQIRAMRLGRQIADARDRATERAKADTWQGWIAARESLGNIVSASSTLDNRAALARAKALMAYEFGDGLADAKATVESLGDGGLDGEVADAYIALAQNDVKAAKASAERALAISATDPGALYVTAQAALLAGDVKNAVAAFRGALEREPRPLYSVGLARALAASGMLDDAIAATDRALAASADNPAAAIARAELLVEAGRVLPNVATGTEVRTQLDRLIAEGGKPVTDQTHGVSPLQLEFADLALARVDFALGGLGRAIGDVNNAAKVRFDDQRFAEQAVDTLYRIGQLAPAVTVADDGIKGYPGSRVLKISLAQVLTAQGKPTEALDVLAKAPDAVQLPKGLAVRGAAKAAAGDADGARADFDAALKKIPDLELALVGKAWLDLAANQVDDARKLIEKRIKPTGSTVALTTVYAAILRASGDAKSRDDARKLLEKIVTGGQGIDVARAQLELARIYRDSGELRAARAAYAEATRTGNVEARLEIGLVQLEDHDPTGAKETLEQLLKDLGDHAPPNVLLEAARVRMLAGDNAGGAALLDAAAKSNNVVKWQVDRERGRLALRRSDFAGAAQALSRAMDGCGDDAETFLLAGDVVDGDDRQLALATKVKSLAPDRLRGKPEAQIVSGLLALSTDTATEPALAAYTAAREALERDNASYRRRARANFGLALIAILKKDATAKDKLDVVIAQDPSLYDAYLYAADLALERNQPKQALSHAQNAAMYNPDSVAAWHRVGLYASKAGDPKALGEAITHLNEIAPNTEEYREIAQLRRR